MVVGSSFSKRSSLVAITVLLLGTPAAVRADGLLPNASSDIILTVNQSVSSQNLFQTLTSDTTFSNTSGGASASGTASLNPSPTISVTTSVSGPGQQAIAQESFGYYFEYVFSSNESIPIIFNANGSVSPSATTANSAQLQVNAVVGGATLLSASACQAGAGTGSCTALTNSPTFSLATQLVLNTNQQYLVQETVYAIAQSGFNDTSTSTIDPFMTFAPGFDSTGITLELSSNIGNSPLSPVPGPTVGAGASSFGLAALFLGWLVRRRRHQMV